MPKKAVRIVQDESNPYPAEVIATAILKMAEIMRGVNASRLKREALVTLITDSSKVTKTTMRIVLNNLDELESMYLKPKSKRTMGPHR